MISPIIITLICTCSRMHTPTIVASTIHRNWFIWLHGAVWRYLFWILMLKLWRHLGRNLVRFTHLTWASWKVISIILVKLYHHGWYLVVDLRLLFITPNVHLNRAIWVCLLQLHRLNLLLQLKLHLLVHLLLYDHVVDNLFLAHSTTTGPWPFRTAATRSRATLFWPMHSNAKLWLRLELLAAVRIHTHVIIDYRSFFHEALLFIWCSWLYAWSPPFLEGCVILQNFWGLDILICILLLDCFLILLYHENIALR